MQLLLNQSDRKSSFSTYGSWVDVATPGSNIYSTYKGSTYQSLSGTSMATPHVAGVATLLANQGYSNTQIRQIIESTTDKISGTGTYWKTVESMHIRLYNTLSNYKKIKLLKKTLISRSTMNAE